MVLARIMRRRFCSDIFLEKQTFSLTKVLNGDKACHLMALDLHQERFSIGVLDSHWYLEQYLGQGIQEWTK